MIRQLKPWAYGPFEVLMHAEMHYRAGEDLDRRIAMIGFDNAIEVTITTYLSLHPMQRRERIYEKITVEGWLRSFHTKVNFFFTECIARCVDPSSKKDEIVWFHDVRNGQYHNGGAAIPQRRELEGVRSAALEVFAILFEEEGVPLLLEQHIAALNPPPPPPRTAEHDRLIDNEYGMVVVCGKPQYTSEVIYSLDAHRYREIAIDLLQQGSELDATEDGMQEGA